MKAVLRLAMFRLTPVLFVALAAIAYVFHTEGPDAYAVRNSVPILLALLLAALTLYKGDGHWTGAGYRWLLGTIGFALPTLGLSMYLHYGYATDLHGMFSESLFPGEVFRYLPWYTAFAGAIGCAIGWIAGKNV